MEITGAATTSHHVPIAYLPILTAALTQSNHALQRLQGAAILGLSELASRRRAHLRARTINTHIIFTAVSFYYLRVEEFLLGGRQCSHYLGLYEHLLLLNGLFLFALEDLLLVLQGHLVGCLARLLTAQFKSVCSIQKKILYDSYEAPLLHFLHVAVLSAEIH